MSRIDFIPRADAVFNVWQGNLVNKVMLNMGQWGIPPTALDAVLTAKARWEAAFVVADDPATRTSAAILEKQEAKAEYVAELRHSAFSRKTTFVRDYNEADRGKMVYYAACYENSKGEAGPYSDIVSCIIP
jgi:hypothetical protein